MAHEKKTFSSLSSILVTFLICGSAAADPSETPAFAVGRAVLAAVEAPAVSATLPPQPATPSAAPSESVAAAPVAAATPGAFPGGANPTPPAGHDPMHDAPAMARPGAARKAAYATFVPILKIGSVVGGSGTYATECKSFGGVACGSIQDTEYEEKSVGGLGVDLLWHTSRKLRLGFGGLVSAPKHAIQGEDFAYGPEVQLYGILEGFFPTSDSFALTVRGQLGGSMLIAGEDHRDGIDESNNSCTQFDKCESNYGPFPGVTYGIGFGLNFRVGESTRLRADIIGESYARLVAQTTVSDAGSGVEVTTVASGSRGWLMLGIEL